MTADDIRPLLPPDHAEEDPTTIAVRAYLELPEKSKHSRKRARKGGHFRPLEIPNSEYTIIFDTETYLDAAQDFRFGTFQVREGEALDEEGIFFDPERLPRRDRRILRRYAEAHGLTVRTLDDFIESIFFDIGYDLGATIVGFNLPFDISRIARGHVTAKTRSMRGGFSFELSGNPRRARVQVKLLSRAAPSIRFAMPE